MAERTATIRRKGRPRRDELIRRHGLYAPTFTAEELRRFDVEPEARPEFKLLRTKILRLAKLTPLKKINDRELDALIKLVRVVAALDVMERTNLMARKVEGAVDPVLAALAEMDPDEL
jgi:hypothetical protein